MPIWSKCRTFIRVVVDFMQCWRAMFCGLAIRLLISRGELEYRWKSELRTEHNDARFYRGYCQKVGVGLQIVDQMRISLTEAVGIDFHLLMPDDNIALIDEELDFEDVRFRLSRDLGISLPKDDWKKSVDGTFGAMVQCVGRCRCPNTTDRHDYA